MRRLRRFQAVFALCLLAFPLAAERVVVSVLATTDLHGNIYPIDYFRDQPAARGLARISTLVRAARTENPNALLIDCGDTIQGTPLEYVYQQYVRTGKLPLSLPMPDEPLRADPMMLAMNHLRYDALVLGNHDFNYGLRSLDRARADARFPWLSANTAVEPGSGRRPFAPYLLKTVAGVRVAVIGVTTPAIPNWEKPENYRGYRFEPAVEAVERTLAQLRSERPDLVVVAAHAGRGPDPGGGAEAARGAPGENMALEIATRVEGVDAVVYGHSHLELAGEKIGNVLLVQPRNWGMSLARLDFTLERSPDGRFAVVEKTSRLIPVRADTEADPELIRIARPYHEAAERYLNTVVAEVAEPLDGAAGRVEDTPLVDAIQAVQLAFTGADVSFTAMFNPRLRVAKGPVTVRQIAALYVYDNELYALEGDGKMVKDALENSARYFVSCRDEACTRPPLTNPRVAGYNYDMAEGVEYEIDLTQPEGNRIRNLRWKGRPLSPGQKLRIAVNNYRAGGSGGYGMFRSAPVVWQSGEDIRQLIIDYYSRKRQLPVKADGNWRIVPAAARETLLRQAQAEARQAAAR